MACSVLGCDSTKSNNHNNYTFHRFPKNLFFQNKWIKILERDGWTPLSNSLVCSKHFEEDCFIQTNNIRHLMKESLPTLYVPRTRRRKPQLASNATQSGDIKDWRELQNSSMDYSMTPCELKICRVCFVTDCKLYSMTMYEKLDKAYKMLTGLSIKNEDNLPPFLCYECVQRLLNCIRFRTKSLRAHLIMLEVTREHGNVTLESIKSLFGEHVLGTSLMKHTQVDGCDLKIDHDEQEALKDTVVEIKVEKEVITDNDNYNSMTYSPANHECDAEHNVKVEEGEIDNEDCLNYDYNGDELIDEVKIEIDNKTNVERLYYSNLNDTVIEDDNSSKLDQRQGDDNANGDDDAIFKEPAIYDEIKKEVMIDDPTLHANGPGIYTDNDFESGASEPPSMNILRTEIEHKKYGRTYSRQGFTPFHTFTPSGSQSSDTGPWRY